MKRLLELRLPAAVPTVGAWRKEAHVITIGVDPHKCSHTAVALNEGGEVLDELRVPANKATVTTLQRWARDWPERTWAIEGANGLGHLLAQQLVTEGEVVVDVPATLVARRASLTGATAGRPTASMRRPWPRWLSAITTCDELFPRATSVCSGSSLTVGTSWPESAGEW
ncbi:MAG TPA: hypothetical protein VEQ37_13440 [Actinomycetota bacterium]|nr:hypothetical protein [Actinomycetota bacterium]